MRKLAVLPLLCLLALVSGCSSGMIDTQPVATASTAPGLRGIVHGGQPPVSGAVIQLWSVGTTGDGSVATALLPSASQLVPGLALTDANGNFNITGQYVCPASSSLVYLTASAGNPGLTAGTSNSAILLLTALGQCGSLLTSYPFVTINEVTTVASVAALSPYMTTAGSIGSGSSDAASLAAAFTSISNVLNVATGAALASAPNGGYAPQAEVNSLGDILAPCINSAGPTSASCSMLFAAATPSGGTAPSTALGAALDIALNPGNNVSALFNLATAAAPFQPTLTAAPAQWSVPTTFGATASGYSGSGYTVSGTVSYAGTLSGPVYLTLNGINVAHAGTQGTSISAPGAYTIRGVPPGTYTLQVFMDTLGHGVTNASDPMGSRTVTVGSANVTGANVTLGIPGAVTLNTGPTIVSAAGVNGGVVAQFAAAINNLGVETATSYTLQWSASSSFSTIAGSKTFPAVGAQLLNLLFANGLTNGSVYYLRAYGTSGGSAVGPYSTVYGPVTVAPPSTGSTVSGSVSYNGTPTGPLLVGLYNQDNILSPLYGEVIQNPGSTQPFSVTVPNNSSAVYILVAGIDQNNDGVVDAGDISNTFIQGTPIAVTGTTANQNLALSTGNVTAAAITQHIQQGSAQIYYLSLQLRPLAKLPVAVTLLSSANADGANVVGPMDLALCGQIGSNCGEGFQIVYSFGATSPTIGDSYSFNVTYSDGTSEIVTAAVTNVLSTFATSLAPTTGTSTSTTPTFTWADPVCSACGTYTYNFSISSASGEIWGVPNYGTGLAPGTTSVVWGVDPSDPVNVPSSTLSPGTTYTWQVTVQDSHYNYATTVATYNP